MALARKEQMLDKRSNNAEPTPARRVLRLFGLDNGRDKSSPTAKNRPPKEPEERKQQFATWYIFAAFLGVMLIQYLWIQYTQVETIPLLGSPCRGRYRGQIIGGRAGQATVPYHLSACRACRSSCATATARLSERSEYRSRRFALLTGTAVSAQCWRKKIP